MAGVSRLQYTNEIRLIRVMCSGRVDLEFILRAFAQGQDGVFIGGCKLGECNYVTQGNFDALGISYIGKKILSHIGLSPERLDIRFMSAGDGHILAEAVDTFTRRARELGPIGESEGIGPDELAMRLSAARKLVPYLRLFERERLRVQAKTEKEYRDHFESEAVNALLDEVLDEKLAVGQIMLLLEESPLSTAQISERLKLKPADVSKHMNSSSRQGLVSYDVDSKLYALA